MNRLRKVIGAALVAAALVPIGGTSSAAPGGGSPAAIEVDVTNSPDFRNGQPEIAVNPKNPRNLVYTSTIFSPGRLPIPPGECFVAHSRDRGATWTKVDWPLGDRPQCGESQVEVDANGTFYIYSNQLGCPPGAPDPVVCNLVLNRTAVSRSTDGGHTWSAPVQTPLFIGGSPKFRVDTATGKIYTLAGFNTALFPSGLSVSADQGRTWSAPTLVPGPTDCLPPPIPGIPEICGFPGTQIAVHDGILALARQSVADGVTFSTSTDDGQTFTDHLVTDSDGVPVPGVPPLSPSDPGGGADPLPWITADPSRTGRFAAMMHRGDTFEVYVTNDAGETWQGPAIVEAPNAFNPWIEFGAHAGFLGVMWRATTEPAGGVDAFSAVSFNAGRSFSGALRVNAQTQPIDESGSPGDDWSLINIWGPDVYITWSDGRTGGAIDGIVARVPLWRYLLAPPLRH